MTTHVKVWVGINEQVYTIGILCLLTTSPTTPMQYAMLHSS